MNLTEQIESLFKRGVVAIDIGTVPKSSDYFIKAGIVVPTGPGQDHVQVTAQVSASSLADCLNTISKQADHVAALKPTILQVKGGRG